MDLQRLYDDVMDFVYFFGACALLVAFAAVKRVREFFAPAVMCLAILGCSFQPVRIEGLCEECNMAYSVMSLVYNRDADKSLAVIPMGRCYAVLQRERCRIEIYGKEKSVDYNDAKKYRDYSQCLAELDK